MHRPRSTRGSKHKPSKGHNMFRAQIRRTQIKKDAEKRLRDGTGHDKKTITEQMRQNWVKLRRWLSLNMTLRGKHTPHQGTQERARRVRQMQEGKCIDPIAIADYRALQEQS